GLFEIFAIQRAAYRVDVPAEETAGEIGRGEQAAAGRRRDRVVDGVVRVRRSDVAGFNTLERVRTGDAAEIDVLEIIGRRSGFRLRARYVVPVVEPHPPEAAS